MATNETITIIKTDQVKPCTFNNRTSMDPLKLQAMKESIKVKGITVPLIVRPKGKLYEVLCGHRRLKCAEDLKLETLPCMIREYTDGEAREIMAIENLQREDLSPLDEAQFYQELLTVRKCTPAILSETIGMEETRIKKYLTLTNLTPTIQEGFLNHKLTLQAAFSLARMPNKTSMEETYKNVVKAQWDKATKEPIASSYFTQYAKQAFMLKLSEAPFKVEDAQLDAKAGPCTTCLFKSGNQPILFDDITEKDLCTNPGCYRHKCTLNWNIVSTKAKAEGKTILPNKTNGNSLFDHWGNLKTYQTPFVEIHSSVRELMSGKDGTWKSILKDLPQECKVERFVVCSHQGKIYELIKEKDALSALRKAGFTFQGEERKKKESQMRREEKLKKKMEKEAFLQMCTLIHQHSYQKPLLKDKDVYQMVVHSLSWQEAELILSIGFGNHTETTYTNPYERLKKETATLNGKGWMALMHLVCVVREYLRSGKAGDYLNHMCKFYKIDTLKIRNEIKAKMEEAPVKKAKPQTPATAK